MLLFIVAFAYLQIGFQLGRAGWAIWDKKDNLSLGSFLLFPVSHAKRKVGVGTMPLFQGVHAEQGAYRAAMTLFWPVAACFNAVALALLVPGWIAALPDRRRRLDARRLALLEAQSRAWDAKIARLETGRHVVKTRIAADADDAEEGDVRVNERLIEEMRATSRQWNGG